MTSIDSPHNSSLTLDASASPALTSSPAFHPLISSLDDTVDLATLDETESSTATPIHSHLEASITPLHSLDASSTTPLHSSLDPSSTPLHTHITSQSSSSLDDTLMHDDTSNSLFSPALGSSQPSLDDIPVISIPSVKLKDENEDDDDDVVEDESEDESEEEESEEEGSEDEDGNSRRRPRDSVGDEDDDEPVSKRPRTQSSSFLQVPSSSLVASSSPSLTSSSPHHKLSIDESPSITSSQPDSNLFSTFDTSSSHHDLHDNLFADADEDLIPLSPRPSQMNGNHHHIQEISLGRGMTSPSNKQSVTQYLLGVQGYTPSSRATGESSLPDDPNVEIEYGTMISDVYGWKMTEHAQALGTDEPVELIRWQEHPHDPYAIRVENVMNEFCGVLGKDDASALAPLLDRHWIKLHGSTLVKDENQFRVRIHVMGLPIHCLEAEKWIRKWPSRYISKQNPNYGVPATGTAGIEDQTTGPMDGIQLREIESDLEKLFDFAGDMNKMPMASKPPAIITHLYPYQRQGLQWMLEQESQRIMATDETSFLFWEKKVEEDGTISYYNKATRATQKEPPERNRGGILADEMGLGKTLQIISLIAATSHDCLVQERKASWLSSFKIEDDDDDHDRDTTPFQLKDYVSRAREGKQAPTLIVCPLSVITNWQQQCSRHTREHYLSVITYHGQHRAKIADQLKHHDVVITTYNILASEYHGQVGEDVDEDEPVKPKPKKKKSSADSPDFKPAKRRIHRESPLFKMRWFRIVLDEAHIIRDRNTRQSRAAVALKAERRWAVTGTPFQNRIGDAFALLAFLRVQPFTNHNIWSRLIITPLKNRDPKGLERLQMTMSAICLRRKKTEEIDGKPILTLPPKYQHIIKVELSPHEQSLYDILAMSGKAQFRAMMSDDQVLSNYAYVLEILLRMRQACDHISLIPEAYHHGFDRQHVDEMKRLLMLLDESLTDDCALCHRVVEDPVITPCAHFYCKKCFDDTVPKMIVPTCPSCAMPIVLDKVVSHDMAKKIVHADQAKLDRDATRAADGNDSAKLKRLIIELRRQKQEDPTSKAIVFSQWTSFLNIVQAALFRKGITYVRLDGDMSSTNRAKALEAFENNPSIRVFLISLKAGGVGLNLTTANKVFLMDPWWNPATEDQAVDRVHRLGQTKPVEVIRFIAANTLEEKILELQNTKRQMISTALSRYQKSRKEQQEERLNDLAILFK